MCMIYNFHSAPHCIGTSLLFTFLAPSNRLSSLDFHWWTDFKIIFSYNDYLVIMCIRKWLTYSSHPYGNVVGFLQP